MALPTGETRSQLFVSRFQNMLDSVGDVLQLQLQIWTQGKGPLFTLDPADACLQCSSRTPSVFSLCQQHRWTKSREALRFGHAAPWSCGHGVDLAALPIQTTTHRLGALIAVDGSPLSKGTRILSADSPAQAPKDPDAAKRPVWQRPELGSRSESGETKDDAVTRQEAFKRAAQELTYEGLDPRGLAQLGRDEGSTETRPELKDDGLWLETVDPERSPSPEARAARENRPTPPAGITRVAPPAARPEGVAFQKKLVFLRDLIQLITEQMTMASEMQSLTEELYTRSEELSMLTSVTGRLTEFHDARTNISYVLQQAMRTVEADAGAVNVLDRKIQEATVRLGSGKDLSMLDSRGWHRLGIGLRNTLSWSESRSFLGRPSLLEQDGLELPDTWQILSVGFPDSGNLNGYMALIRCDSQRKFELNDLRLLRSLVHEVEVTVSNADLYDNLKNFLIATVKSLVHAIEAKDTVTSGHSERVNILSMLLGKTMGLDEQTLEVLRWASLLHDVGKIGMPEHILLKPGELTPEEYEIVKEHPERGYRILSPVQQLQEASEGVRGHHEMVNGQGYPFGLVGEEIPLLARIIAVADTYDALTQTRPYRKARPVSQAMEEIRRVRGSQLDPEVVDALEKLFPFLEENQIMIDAVSRAA